MRSSSFRRFFERLLPGRFLRTRPFTIPPEAEAAPDEHWEPAVGWEAAGDPNSETFKRRWVYPKMKLTALQEMFGGDLVEACRAKGLEFDRDAEDRIVSILDVGTSLLNDADFRLLAQFEGVRRIVVRFTRLTDDALAALADMPELEALCLHTHNDNFRLSDGALSHLRHLPNLKELHLECANVSGIGLAHVAQPDLLENLGLTISPVTDAGLEIIGRFRNLRQLLIGQEAKVSDAGLSGLRECRALREIDLSLCDCRGLTSAWLEGFREHPALEAISFGRTAVSDECAHALLAMPALKELDFGDRQVSAATVDRLRARGIDVEHGRLSGLRLESNVLRYDGHDFTVDPDESEVRAFVPAEGGDIEFEIEVACLDEYVPRYGAPARLIGPRVPISPRWREWAGAEFRVPDDGEDGNNGTIHDGQDETPTDHLIRFGRRTGNRFMIDWTCIVAGDESPDKPVQVVAEIEFKQVIVWRFGELSLAEARWIVGQQFDPADLGEPVADRYKELRTYLFPVVGG